MTDGEKNTQKKVKPEPLFKLIEIRKGVSEDAFFVNYIRRGKKEGYPFSLSGLKLFVDSCKNKPNLEKLCEEYNWLINEIEQFIELNKKEK